MKQLLLMMLIAILGAFTSVRSQNEVRPAEKCSLTLAQSPEIRGIRLGMRAEEVLSLFPGSGDDAQIRYALSIVDKTFGVARFSVVPDRYTTKQKFEGISQFSFDYLDGALSSFYVGYNGPEWKSVDEFISRLSALLNLPGPENWERSNLDTLKKLRCQGFELTASIGGSEGNSNYLNIRTTTAERIVQDRIAESKEKARSEFKP